jgi:hypothetical protein
LDLGRTWITTTIDSVGEVGAYCSMTILSGKIFISYSEISNGYSVALKVATSGDAGETWNLQTIVTGSNIGSNTSICGEGTHIYIAYLENFKLKFIKSSDAGITWPAASIREINNAVTSVGNNSLFVQNDKVYVSYFDEINSNLMFSKSTDKGDTWNQENNKCIDNNEYVGTYNSLIADGDNLFVSYYDNTFASLKLAKSTDMGNTWSVARIDSIESVGEFTSIAKEGNAIFISYYEAYYEIQDKGGHLKFARSDDNGLTWTTSTLDSQRDVGRFTSLMAEGSAIYISYYAYHGGDLKFIKSTDNGKHF